MLKRTEVLVTVLVTLLLSCLFPAMGGCDDGQVRAADAARGASATGREAADPGAEAPAFVWQEAEEFSATNWDEDDYWNSSDRGHLLSADKFIASRLQGDAAENPPEEGYFLEYEIDVPESGSYDAWARIGMEGIRAPFQWRIDEGEWRDGPADRWTTNVMQLARYNEVGWLDLGEIELDSGRHTLTVRYTESQPNRNDMFMVLDCFAFVDAAADWLPEGDLKPGESYDADIDRQAAEQVYSLPAPGEDGERTDLKLTGLWQVARWDDTNMDENPWEPETELPDLD
ncbi:MAG: hypothetical protein ACOCUJ_04510, partial [Thiohalospira sp.]